MIENMNNSKIKSKVNTVKERDLGGCLVYVFKQQFSVFKQHFTHFHTCTKRVLKSLCASFNYFNIGEHTRKIICIIIENKIESLHIHHCKIS